MSDPNNNVARRALRHEEPASDWSLALAFALNRIDHCARVIAPALAIGRHVLSDRYVMSSLVYQAQGGITEGDILRLNRLAVLPDITFYLDAEPDICLDRIQKRGGSPERFEGEVSRMMAQRKRYREVISAPAMGRIVVVNGDLPVEVVLSAVVGHWQNWYEQQTRGAVLS